MLVLSRKKDECIVINNDITIVVVEIRGDKVRLGVEAPKEVPVHRREVFDAITRAAGDVRDGSSNSSDPACVEQHAACVEQHAGPATPQEGKSSDATGEMAVEPAQLHVHGQVDVHGQVELESRIDG